MSFKESIIIPLELYQRCQLQTKTKDLNILLDKSLPTDEKMKLFSQAQLEKKRKKRKNVFTSKAEFNEISPVGSNILQLIPRADKPIIKAILDIIKQNPPQISWNTNNEVILDGKTLINSNIIDNFLYMRKHLTVTKDKDIPEGIVPFYRKLLSLNIAPEWIKQTPARKSTRRKTKSKKKEEEQEGEEEEEYQKSPPETYSPYQKSQETSEIAEKFYDTYDRISTPTKSKEQKKEKKRQTTESNQPKQTVEKETKQEKGRKTPRKTPQKAKSPSRKFWQSW